MWGFGKSVNSKGGVSEGFSITQQFSRQVFSPFKAGDRFSLEGLVFPLLMMDELGGIDGRGSSGADD